MNNISRQRGAVLFVSLIFLIILALLGIAASSNSILQYKMTNGLRDAQISQFGSESALRAGEVVIFAEAQRSLNAPALPFCPASSICKFDSSNSAKIDPTVVAFRTATTPCFDGSGPPCSTTVTGVSTIGTNNFQSNWASVLGQASVIPGDLPQFIIEDLGTDTPPGGMINLNGQNTAATAPHLFRITARSLGAGGNSVRVTESVFVPAANNQGFQTSPPPSGP